MYRFAELAGKREVNDLLETFRLHMIASRGDKKSVKKFEEVLNGAKG
jgi:hypothetical protein